MRGKTLMQLAVEIERRANAKKDFIVNTSHLQMHGDDESERVSLQFPGFAIGINSIAHEQIGEHTGIPKAYYDKMLKDSPHLLATNVNMWFDKYPAVRMVRTLDKTCRAFPSDKYRPLENENLAEAVLPVLRDLDLAIISSEITDRRLYIKAVDKKVERELAKHNAKFGDGGHKIVHIASPAITISNSEVCCGALSVLGGVYDGFCSNLATFGERSLRRSHVGARHELADDQTFALLSDDTRAKTDVAIWAQVRDVVRGTFERARFDALCDKIEGAVADKIEGDVVKAVTLASKKLNLTDGEGKSVLRHLIEGGDLTRFGLYNAVTRAAQDVESYDRSCDLEKIGAHVIELPRHDWKQITEAA
jgi:hypothetical protein